MWYRRRLFLSVSSAGGNNAHARIPACILYHHGQDACKTGHHQGRNRTGSIPVRQAEMLHVVSSPAIPICIVAVMYASGSGVGRMVQVQRYRSAICRQEWKKMFKPRSGNHEYKFAEEISEELVFCDISEISVPPCWYISVFSMAPSGVRAADFSASRMIFRHSLNCFSDMYSGLPPV